MPGLGGSFSDPTRTVADLVGPFTNPMKNNPLDIRRKGPFTNPLDPKEVIPSVIPPLLPTNSSSTPKNKPIHYLGNRKSPHLTSQLTTNSNVNPSSSSSDFKLTTNSNVNPSISSSDFKISPAKNSIKQQETNSNVTPNHPSTANIPSSTTVDIVRIKHYPVLSAEAQREKEVADREYALFEGSALEYLPEDLEDYPTLELHAVDGKIEAFKQKYQSEFITALEDPKNKLEVVQLFRYTGILREDFEDFREELLELGIDESAILEEWPLEELEMIRPIPDEFVGKISIREIEIFKSSVKIILPEELQPRYLLMKPNYENLIEFKNKHGCNWVTTLRASKKSQEMIDLFEYWGAEERLSDPDYYGSDFGLDRDFDRIKFKNLTFVIQPTEPAPFDPSQFNSNSQSTTKPPIKISKTPLKSSSVLGEGIQPVQNSTVSKSAIVETVIGPVIGPFTIPVDSKETIPSVIPPLLPTNSSSTPKTKPIHYLGNRKSPQVTTPITNSNFHPPNSSSDIPSSPKVDIVRIKHYPVLSAEAQREKEAAAREYALFEGSVLEYLPEDLEDYPTLELHEIDGKIAAFKQKYQSEFITALEDPKNKLEVVQLFRYTGILREDFEDFREELLELGIDESAILEEWPLEELEMIRPIPDEFVGKISIREIEIFKSSVKIILPEELQPRYLLMKPNYENLIEFKNKHGCNWVTTLRASKKSQEMIDLFEYWGAEERLSDPDYYGSDFGLDRDFDRIKFKHLTFVIQPTESTPFDPIQYNSINQSTTKSPIKSSKSQVKTKEKPAKPAPKSSNSSKSQTPVQKSALSKSVIVETPSRVTDTPIKGIKEVPNLSKGPEGFSFVVADNLGKGIEEISSPSVKGNDSILFGKEDEHLHQIEQFFLRKLTDLNTTNGKLNDAIEWFPWKTMVTYESTQMNCKQLYYMLIHSRQNGQEIVGEKMQRWFQLYWRQYYYIDESKGKGRGLYRKEISAVMPILREFPQMGTVIRNRRITEEIQVLEYTHGKKLTENSSDYDLYIDGNPNNCKIVSTPYDFANSYRRDGYVNDILYTFQLVNIGGEEVDVGQYFMIDRGLYKGKGSEVMAEYGSSSYPWFGPDIIFIQEMVYNLLAIGERLMKDSNKNGGDIVSADMIETLRLLTKRLEIVISVYVWRRKQQKRSMNDGLKDPTKENPTKEEIELSKDIMGIYDSVYHGLLFPNMQTATWEKEFQLWTISTVSKEKAMESLSNILLMVLISIVTGRIDTDLQFYSNYFFENEYCMAEVWKNGEVNQQVAFPIATIFNNDYCKLYDQSTSRGGQKSPQLHYELSDVINIYSHMKVYGMYSRYSYNIKRGKDEILKATGGGDVIDAIKLHQIRREAEVIEGGQYQYQRKKTLLFKSTLPMYFREQLNNAALVISITTKSKHKLATPSYRIAKMDEL